MGADRWDDRRSLPGVGLSCVGRFIRFALNSTSELEYHLIVARDIQAIKASDFDSLSTQTIEVRKMLHGLLKRVISSTRTPPSEVPAS